MRPRTIVSVLDSSTPMKHPAVAQALALARWHEAMLHVVDVSVPNGAATASRGVRRAALDRRIAHIAGGAAGVPIIPAVLAPGTVRAVADYSRRVSADLIVVTDAARRGSVHWRPGSFAAALGTTAAVPTLTVSSEPREPEVQAGAFRNILSAVDFSEVSLRALATALDLAQQSGGRLRLLHVLDGLPHAASHAGWDASRLGRTFRALAARMDRELESLIPPEALNWSEIAAATVLGPPHDAIVAQASHERADLIVIGLPRRSRLRALLAGSTAHKVLRRATSPVLLVPGAPASPVRAAEGVLRVARAASL